VGDLEQAIDATRRVDSLDRRACRDAFDRRFTVGRMAQNYVALYDELVETGGSVAAA
jgi:hypothetical protein